MDELFFLSADELQHRLDKIESGNHSFKWDSEEYPRFIEKVTFQPKKCNVEFPPIGPRAFSRGVRSTSSLPDIRSTENIELMSNEDESTRSISVEKKPRRSKKKTKPRFNSPILSIKVPQPTFEDEKPLFCEGKGFPKSDHSIKESGSPSKIAVERVRAENSSSKPDIMAALPRIHDTTKLQTTQVGPWFRAWTNQKRERCEILDSDKNTKHIDFHLDAIEQKAIRSFDLDGLLKDVRRHQSPRAQSVDEISLNSATNYVAKMKQQLDVSAKGGGFMNRAKHVTVKDEIQIKKMLRQKLFAFYDFGGSGNAFERVVSDACSKNNPSIKYKNLPAYQTEERDIFPLAAPHTNLPLLPNSPSQLQKLYNLLDTMPWFSWQPRRPVQAEVVRGSPQHKPLTNHIETEMVLSDSEDDFEIKNPKLEVRLPSCVV